MDLMLIRVDEYETLLTENRIWIARTRGVGVIAPEDAVLLGLTGPCFERFWSLLRYKKTNTI